MKRTKTILTLVSAMALIMTLFASPASAAGNGEVAFSGTANLPEFPSANNVGNFNGTASGTVEGSDGGTPYAATYIDAGMTATFTYNEPTATCPLVGTASTPGSQQFRIVAPPRLLLAGTYGTTPVTSLEITGDFSWQRAGATAVITISNATLRLNGILVETGGTGAATAVFESPDALACDGSSLSATVAGAGDIAWPNP